MTGGQLDAFAISDFAAAVLMERIVRGAYETKNSSEIQPLQWSILRYLDRCAEDRCTLTLITGFLGLTHAPVSRAVRTMRDRGLVRQRSHPRDARSTIISLTDAGRDALELDPIRKIALLVCTLPDADRSAIKRALRSISVDLSS
ncbi:MarR family winged helix-turn-helix transcriptional regulator [Rhodovulum sp. YEN HP10]|uniref:MarR family winged helix-turn-helix transcriptional regulator n=1 Tax=Rhodovulum sp. HP10 TaxID=3387397 RepID=UPI0039E06199